MTSPNDYGAVVTIGGMSFNTNAADATVPEQEWYASVIGWEACPKRVMTLPNVHEDGDQPQFMTLAARPLTLRGTVQVTGANPQALLDAARYRLMLATMAHPDALVQLTVAETVNTFAMVHLAEDAPQWNVASCDDTGGVARFVVGLVAPAGAKYSTVETATALGVGIATPSPGWLANSTGGSLGTGVYGYRVSAVGAAGETLASPTVSVPISAVATPGKPSISTSSTGGSLAFAGSFSYRVSAVNGIGETLASEAVTLGTGGAGGANTRSNTITWSPVSGATGYKVYGRTSGAEQLLTPSAITATSFVDTGSVTPSGALPASNTTATTTNSITLSWNAVAGATGYNVYGRTPGSELKLTPSPITAITFTDTGAVTPSGALPTQGGASVQVTNNGNWGSPPRVEVDGPTSGGGALYVALGDKLVQVDTDLAAGEDLVLDFATKEVLVNGQDRRDLLHSLSEWWKLPPGTSRVDYAGGGTATFYHRHAYA